MTTDNRQGGTTMKIASKKQIDEIAEKVFTKDEPVQDAEWEKEIIDWLEESYNAPDNIQKCREDTLLSDWFIDTCKWAVKTYLSHSPNQTRKGR